MKGTEITGIISYSVIWDCFDPVKFEQIGKNSETAILVIDPCPLWLIQGKKCINKFD